MPSPLRNFTLFWNLGLRFFLDPTTSPRCCLDWDCQNTDGTPLLLGGAAEGALGPEPVPQIDRFLRLWLATFAVRACFRLFLESVLPLVCYHPSHRLPVFDFRSRIADYPRVWSLDEIAHQHFLACTWLLFWTIFTKTAYNTTFSESCHMGFWVSWSEWYDQLLFWLFPEVYPDTREASRRPVSGPCHGPAPFGAPPGIARIRLIPIGEPDVRSGFQPSPDLSVHLAQDEAVWFSTDGVLEYLDEIASSNGQWASPEEIAPPRHIMVGDELDLEIIAAGLLPGDFLGATLPTPPRPLSPTLVPSPPAAHAPSPPPIMVLEVEEPSPVPTPSLPPAPLSRKRARARGTQARSSKASKSGRDPAPLPRTFLSEVPRPKGVIFSNVYESGNDKVLREFQDSRPHIKSFSYFILSLARHAPWRLGAPPHCLVVAAVQPSKSRWVLKRSLLKMKSPPQEGAKPRVTDEDDAPALADDPRNYDFEDEDVQMSSLETPIVTDACNYNPRLEPVSPVVPPEQQASSFRRTLDDPPLLDARFLGFRLRPVAELVSASRSSFVEEILQQSAEDAGDEGQLESALLLMSEVFGQAGRCLGQRHRGAKGKGKERAL
ncbi:hypothetical protein DFH08DRAFT_814246 [Mycena albidolilacea]|uniref:Aminotransferase-like plant mobile domain-containing protein n=1 Tax=Mycena albidolilacea TaxID=1033008 RepID=A0AAD6ZQP9_9AGAR|nr:hypothetical protein DFH08DRAFT_814246 [Mycena albidolilacea]